MNPLDAQLLAQQEMTKHGLMPRWSFGFNNRYRAAGVCKISELRIELSRPYVECNEQDAVMDTIRHEIAHALTPGDGHGRKWKAKCRELGCRPSATFTGGKNSENSPTKHAPSPSGKWGLFFGHELITTYQRCPRAKIRDIKHVYLRGRKKETLGKLVIKQLS